MAPLFRTLRLVLLVALCRVAVGSEHHHPSSSASFSPAFYYKSCPKAEEIVRSIVMHNFSLDPTVAAPLLRLHFHDCFVQGCDASVLLDSKRGSLAEKDAPPNLSLGAFDVIDAIKAALEAACPRTVSCADILALAARDAIYLAGGPLVEVGLGRRDGATSLATQALKFLPASTLNVSGLVANFAAVGLGFEDVLALSGAHTIGQGHCTSFSNRLAPNRDPVLAKPYAQYLNAKCKAPHVDPTVVVNNDLRTPTRFDNQYYKNLVAGYGLFSTDEVLFTDKRTKATVLKFASDKAAFFQHFAASFKKMGELSLLTGSKGQIRLNCHLPNKA